MHNGQFWVVPIQRKMDVTWGYSGDTSHLCFVGVVEVHLACIEMEIYSLLDHPFLPTLYNSFQVVDPIESHFKDEEARAQAIREFLNCIVEYMIKDEEARAQAREFLNCIDEYRVDVQSMPIYERDAVSYLSALGGVDHWQNDYDHDDDFDLKSMLDNALEVVCISDTWHLGKLQVGLSKAQRLAQGNVIRLHIQCPFPVKVDREPWIQQPGFLEITHHGQVFMMRKASEEPTGHAAAMMTEVLLNVESNGIINTTNKRLLLQQMAIRLS